MYGSFNQKSATTSKYTLIIFWVICFCQKEFRFIMIWTTQSKVTFCPFYCSHRKYKSLSHLTTNTCGWTGCGLCRRLSVYGAETIHDCHTNRYTVSFNLSVDFQKGTSLTFILVIGLVVWELRVRARFITLWNTWLNKLISKTGWRHPVFI